MHRRCWRRIRRLCMRLVGKMGLLFRVLVGLGVLMVIISGIWSGLYSSTRHRLVSRRRSLAASDGINALHRVDPSDNRTWRPLNSLLTPRDNGQFYLDNVPRLIVSGELHYFRVHPTQWEDRLRRMRTAGLNTITTRIPWNIHEKRRGLFEFDGLFNLPDFIRLTQRLGFLLMVHVGPYIDADWEFGGLPHWLLHDSNMAVRTATYSPYSNYVERYFSQLLPLLARFTFRRRGPIIALQIEHELGSYTADSQYLASLARLVRQHGIDELLLTADHSNHLDTSPLNPGLLRTVSCYDDVKSSIQTLRTVQPRFPVLVTVYMAGAATRWNEPHTRTSADTFRHIVDTVLKLNASINIYAFTGGTNFGLYSGAVDSSEPRDPRSAEVRSLGGLLGPGAGGVGLKVGRRHRVTRRHIKQLAVTSRAYRPTTTAYNYDAVVSESGHVSNKFHVFRRLLLDHDVISRLQAVPRDPVDSALGVVKLDLLLPWETLLSDVIADRPVTLSSPVYMESLDVSYGTGQGCGWIVYRTRLPDNVNSFNITGVMRDRGLVYVDGRLVSTVYSDRVEQGERVGQFAGSWSFSRRPLSSNNHSTAPAGFDLDIVVENMGRASVGLLEEQHKGFQGHVTAAGNVLDLQWQHVTLDFSRQLVNKLSHVTLAWQPVGKRVTSQLQPTVYRGHFKVRQARDTWLDMTKWSKGLVVLNRFVLGRYWTSAGPQHSLYVPGSLLVRGNNQIIVFELEKTLNGKVKFTSKPQQHHVTSHGHAKKQQI